MRAAVIAAPRQSTLVETELPRPGVGEVRVRIEGCGVCGSHSPLWQGRPWFEYPLPPGAPGHEGWGWIDAVGDGVVGLRAGDRVATLSQRAFAEYDIAAADGVVVLPSSLDALPFPGEALGCAFNVFRRSAIEAGQTVAVVGVGFLGAVIVALAAAAGAHVIALSRRAYALEIARGYGAAATVPWHDGDDPARRVSAQTGGRGCDVVVEVVGLQRSLDVATQLTRERGRLVVAGYHQDGTRTVDMQLWNWRGIDVVNAHERDPAVYVEGMRAAAAAVAAGTFDPLPLLTHRYPLGELDGALHAMDARPAGFMKALVMA